ncbi:MAG: cyclic pyranopterin monophosphate synthase MoaC [Lachnospiraceae bacterium]|jgi:cyclic pyranopterin phosphate synthase|nr:cyclic pyranopterin monophosphate synthase MoaC [Lachnospiraceae bacterium]
MEFTHFDKQGNAVMVEVGDKEETRREAEAAGKIFMSQECLKKVMDGDIQKGDVLGVARIAGIMGAKRTSELIPLCHNLNLTGVEVLFEAEEASGSINAVCRARTTGKTGVEMEALTGVQVALLTIYDMCKAIDKSMVISDVHLCRKSGGKSGEFVYTKKQEKLYEG